MQEVKEIDGKWTLILGEIKITANSKEALESLFNSWREDIPNCSHCDYTPCRCSKEKIMKEKDTLRVYLEMERDTGERIAIFRNLEIEQVLKDPEIIKEVVKECENSLRWYNIIKKMNNGK